MSPVPSHQPVSEQPSPAEAESSPPDVEVIMREVRRAAERAEGTVEDYAGRAAGRSGEVSIGIDDEALIERVMQRVRAMPERPAGPQPTAAISAVPPDPVARQLGFDREREHGAIHRVLGKARRWLFRVTKIQAEFEKMYERVNTELMELERRTGASAIELQQWLERRLAHGDGGSATVAALSDPLALGPERRWRADGKELVTRAEEYVPFVREAAVRSRGAGRRDALDFGCGEGVLLEALQRAGLDVEGLDPNPLRVRRACERGVRAAAKPLREFLLHCPEHEYRCVAAIHVLEYVAEAEVAALVGEFRRIIAPGGRLLVEVPGVADGPSGPVAPEVVRQACVTAGFGGVFTHGLHPAEASEQFPSVDASLPGAGQFNAVIEKLNARFCGPRDTLIVAEN